jgi:hypothetical protein
MTARTFPAFNFKCQTRGGAFKQLRRRQLAFAINAGFAGRRDVTAALRSATELARLPSRIVNFDFSILFNSTKAMVWFAAQSGTRNPPQPCQTLYKITHVHNRCSAVRCGAIDPLGGHGRITAQRTAKMQIGLYSGLCLKIGLCLANFKLKARKQQIAANFAGLFRCPVQMPEGN